MGVRWSVTYVARPHPGVLHSGLSILKALLALRHALVLYPSHLLLCSHAFRGAPIQWGRVLLGSVGMAQRVGSGYAMQAILALGVWYMSSLCNTAMPFGLYQMPFGSCISSVSSFTFSAPLADIPLPVSTNRSATQTQYPILACIVFCVVCVMDITGSGLPSVSANRIMPFSSVISRNSPGVCFVFGINYIFLVYLQRSCSRSRRRHSPLIAYQQHSHIRL